MERPLFDARLVRELDALARRLEIRARSGRGGDHLAKRRGSSSEFREHREYAPGDDPRRIDWSAYARTDEPVLKVFLAEEDLVLRVLCDASASLDFGDPPKIDVARRISAAIGYLASKNAERAQLFVTSDGRTDGGRPARGRAGLGAMLERAARVEARGGTDLANAVAALTRSAKRPGLCALVSDFLDPGPVLDALGRAASAGHDIALVHVFSPEEESPSFEGDLTLEDAETGATIDVTMDAAAIEAYAARFRRLQDSLRAFAKKRGAAYVRADTHRPLLSIMQSFVARSID